VRSAAALCESEQANESRDGLPGLRMNDLTHTGEVDSSDLEWVRLPENDQYKLDLCDGDVLFNRVNGDELLGKIQGERIKS